MTHVSICKIVSKDELEAGIASGTLVGSTLDQADGFLHFSSPDQVAGTLAAHFADATELWLVRVDVSTLGESLRWEASRDGALFPHVYSAVPSSRASLSSSRASLPSSQVSLPMSQVSSVQPIRLPHPQATHPQSVSRRILYLHGWQSSVGGVKPSSLKAAGHEVIEPELDDDDFEAAWQVAQETYDRERPDLVVGSSRGGALAVNLQLPSRVPRIVLCPAWKKWGAATQVPLRTLIMHSTQDDVIPFDDSVSLIENSSLSRSHLIEIGSDHRLATPDALELLAASCIEFPDRMFPPLTSLDTPPRVASSVWP